MFATLARPDWENLVGADPLELIQLWALAHQLIEIQPFFAREVVVDEVVRRRFLKGFAFLNRFQQRVFFGKQQPAAGIALHLRAHGKTADRAIKYLRHPVENRMFLVIMEDHKLTKSGRIHAKQQPHLAGPALHEHRKLGRIDEIGEGIGLLQSVDIILQLFFDRKTTIHHRNPSSFLDNTYIEAFAQG